MPKVPGQKLRTVKLGPTVSKFDEWRFQRTCLSRTTDHIGVLHEAINEPSMPDQWPCDLVGIRNDQPFGVAVSASSKQALG